MPNTYILIASNTVGSGGAASVTFSSIPSTYTDLVIKASTRSSASGGGGGGVWDAAAVRFNGSSTGYSNKYLFGGGTSAASGNGGSTAIDFWTNYSGATTSTFGSTEIYIPNYAGSTNKSVSIDTVAEHNGTNAFDGLNAGLWSNTAAITSIVLTLGIGSWVEHSTFTLYGISNA